MNRTLLTPRVLLIVAPFSDIPVRSYGKFPLGVMYLSSCIKKSGYESRILDLNAEMSFIKGNNIKSIIIRYYNNTLKNKIKEFRPFVIGINVFSSQNFRNAMHLSSLIKFDFKDVPIILGGIHPTLFHYEIMKHYDEIGYIIIGEGEESFLDLLKCLKHATFDRLHDIDGMAFRENGNIIVNKKTSFISNLDEIPFPDYEGIDLEKYLGKNFSKISDFCKINIITTRGCPYKCIFCSMYCVHGKKVRMRSIQNVLAEIEFIINKYKLKEFSFMDDNLTLNRERTLNLFNEIIKNRFNIRFNAINGISIKTLDEEVISTLKKAGMYHISLAVESGSEYIRNEVIGKRVSTQKIIEVFELCRKYKFKTLAFFIFGMPGETKNTLNETRRLIKRIRPDSLGLFNAVPYPGTRLYEYCKNNNILKYDMKELLKSVDLEHLSNKVFIKLEDITDDFLKHFKNRIRVENWFSFKLLHKKITSIIKNPKLILAAKKELFR